MPVRHSIAPNRHSLEKAGVRAFGAAQRGFALSSIRAVDWRHIAVGAAALILAAIAYRSLFETSVGYGLEQDVEMLFFHSTAS